MENSVQSQFNRKANATAPSHLGKPKFPRMGIDVTSTAVAITAGVRGFLYQLAVMVHEVNLLRFIAGSLLEGHDEHTYRMAFTAGLRIRKPLLGIFPAH